MSSATESLARLDRSLARSGETVAWRRVDAAQDPEFSLNIPALIRGYQPSELVPGSGITQQDVKVILSPSDTVETVPAKGDRLVRNGKPLTIQAATGLYIGGILVRIECQARG